MKREAFLVVDAETSQVENSAQDDQLSPRLAYFQHATGARHAFQVVIEKSYVDADCFVCQQPVVVPARTLLSQLL